jgi:hypothetical protein
MFGEDRFCQGLSAHRLAHAGFLRGDSPHTGSFPFIAQWKDMATPISSKRPHAGG